MTPERLAELRRLAGARELVDYCNGDTNEPTVMDRILCKWLKAGGATPASGADTVSPGLV